MKDNGQDTSWYATTKTSVPFRYQLKRFCNVLSWSVTARSRTLMLVINVDQFYLGTKQYVSLAFPVVQTH